MVIPIGIRSKLDINERDQVEIYVDGNTIVFKKFEPSCIFCKKTKNLISYKDKLICSTCLKNINSLKQ